MLLRLERGFVLQPPGLVQRKATGFAFNFNLQMRDAMMFRIAIVLAVFVVTCALPRHASAEFRAGAAVVDVTPLKLPVLVNGNLVIRTVASVKTPLNARAIVLDDGQTRLAIVVVDSCMMPRPFLDEVKQFAATKTGLEMDRILISATHTHSAPSTMDMPGRDADQDYVPYLRMKIVEAIVAAEKNLGPAQVGWTVRNAARLTALRRWVRRPDRLVNDPFGNPTVRASMHAAANWDDVIGESGPEDPDLALISLQARNGQPIAVLANFSMHYFSGEKGLSADYFGLFCEGLKARLMSGADDTGPPFVGVMSHGCSGDIWWRDYAVAPDKRPRPTIESYAKEMVDIALSALDNIEHRHDVDLAMAESRMNLNYRVPDAQRLKWAREIVDAMGDRSAQNSTEFYAVQQILLHQKQSTEIVVQALRIGDIAITTTPNETYALTGLKLKLQSPLPKTMVIELANGADGYIPPPEQHLLGGYNTWAARSAGLEVQAEPKITETALGLLETVSARSRRVFRQGRGPLAEALLDAQPIAWWRLDEFAAPHAADSSARANDAVYEPGVVFFLDGPESERFCAAGETNRSAHFAGGRLRSRLAETLSDRYSVSVWIWNGMPIESRDVTGWMLSRGHDHGLGADSDHLGLGGTAGHTGRLIYQHGNDAENRTGGKTEIPRWQWNHVVFVRDGHNVRVHLNGGASPEIDIELSDDSAITSRNLFFGGRSDNRSNWEGRLDEIAVFDRALSPEEIAKLSPSRD